GAHNDIRAARGGAPVDGAYVVSVHVFAQGVELGALAADQRDVLAGELAELGQLAGEVTAGGEAGQDAEGPGCGAVELARGQAQGARRADGDADRGQVAAAG